MRDGIPVTMPGRTLADLARVATPAKVRRATRKAESRGLPLDDDYVSAKTDSDLEDDFFTHRGRRAFRDDRDRDVWLELRGFTVVRFDDTRIGEDPAGIAEDLLQLLARAA